MKNKFKGVLLLFVLLFALALFAGCAEKSDPGTGGINNETENNESENDKNENDKSEQSAPEIIYDLTGTTLNVYAPEGAEYRLDEGTWQKSGNYTVSRGQT